MKKRSALSGALLVALMLLVTACGNSTPAVGDATKSTDTTPIKIGQIVHMSGSAVESGQSEKQGAELALEQINANGGVKGRKLTLVQEDGKSNNPGVVAAIQKLLGDKDIAAIIGVSASTQVTAMLPTINEAKVPVAIGGTNYGLTHSGSQWVFRFRPNDALSAQVMAQYAVGDLKLTKVAILHSTDAFGSGGRDLAVLALKDLGVTPVLDQGYNNDEKDYTAVINSIKQSGATVIITYMTLATDVGIFAKQSKQQGLKVVWIGSASTAATPGRKLAGDALYGTYAVSDFHVDTNAKSKEFAAAYQKKYGVLPDLYSAWTYDTVSVFAEAMKKAPDLKPESLREAILGIQKYLGAEGEYNFDKNGDGLDAYNVVQNDNDVIKVIKTIRGKR